MGEHIRGFVDISIISDPPPPGGTKTAILLRVSGDTSPAKKLQFIQAVKKAAEDADLTWKEL